MSGEAWDYDPNIPTPMSEDVAGSSGASVLSVDYYRQKVVEFQAVLQSLDLTGTELYEAGTIAYASGDNAAIDEYEALWSQFEAKRSAFVTVAEGIQFASQGINAVGVQFPTVQIPYGLGAVPLAPLAAAAGVIAAAVALITWSKEFFRAVREFAQRAQHLAAIQMLPEGEKAGALEKLRRLELTAQQSEIAANGSPLNALANVGKWVAVAAVALVVWKAIDSRRG